MLLTRNEVIGLIQFAIRNTANTLGIHDVEWKSTDELIPEIEAIDPQTHELLTQFIDAYSEWFGFHEEMEHLHNQGNLSSDEQQILVNKIQKRDNTRQAILHRLNEIADPL